jgi:hypothetical protein
VDMSATVTGSWQVLWQGSLVRLHQRACHIRVTSGLCASTRAWTLVVFLGAAVASGAAGARRMSLYNKTLDPDIGGPGLTAALKGTCTRCD